MSLVLCELADASAFGIPSFSPFCLKIHTALRLAGLPYTRRTAGRPDAHKALNPTGQVPVLVEEGDAPKVTADSSAILRRILALAPGRIAEGPEAWLYEELADTAVNGFLVAARWADDTNWPLTRTAYFGDMPAPVSWIVPGRLRANVVRGLVARDVWRAGPEACWARFELLLDALDGRAPAQGWWCGDEPSVADVALYGQLRSFGTSLTQAQRDAVGRRARLSAWLGRVEAAQGQAP